MKSFFNKCLCFCWCLTLFGCSSGTIITPAKEADLTEISALNSLFESFYSDKDALPLTDKDGNALTYTVVSGKVTVQNGIITKNTDAQEYEPVTLRVSNGNESEEIDNLLVLDPIVAYVISYFTSSGTDAEMLKLAYTYNGTYWFLLNNDEGILKPDHGTKRLRDPSILRTKDGAFCLLATEGYDNPTIYAFDSSDLVTYTNERRIQVNTSSDTLSLQETQAWAPEGFYDRATDQYYLYWSSKDDGGMFYNTSADLESISYPLPLLDTGHAIIDGTFVKTKNGYTWIYKDEEEPMSTRSQLFRTHTDTFDGSMDSEILVFSQHQMEGPMIIKSLENDNWYLFADCYTFEEFKCLYTTDIENGTWKEFTNTEELMLPMEKPAHASAIGVTWKELERLMNAFEN